MHRHREAPTSAALLVGLLVLAAALGASGRSVPGLAATPRALTAGYARLPLQFEPNRGQADPSVRFLARGLGYSLFLRPTESALVLNSPQRAHAASSPTPSAASASAAVTRPAVRMRLVGANRQVAVSGDQELPGKVNYFLGNDPKQWKAGIPTFGRVRCREVYPGIDVLYYGNEGRLEHDFVVQPGADPGAIRVQVEGASRVAVDPRGDLILGTPAGEVRQQRPVVYQVVNGERRPVDGSYELLAEGNGCVGVGVCGCELQRKAVPPSTDRPAPESPTPNAQGPTLTTTPAHPHTHTPTQVAFNLGDYDRTRPLIIDPVLVYSTYLGGGAEDTAYGVAVDAAGSAYVVGTTLSTNFPTTAGAVDTTFSPPADIFVSKLNPAGSGLVYSTYLGGSGTYDKGLAIAVDGTGNAFLTGATSSQNFPVTPGAFQTVLGPSSLASFVTKLNATGSALLYSTFLGPAIAGTTLGSGIAVDGGGNAYVTGVTFGQNYPTTPGAYQTTLKGPSDAFITKLNPAGSGLVYSTFLGGSAKENDPVYYGSAATQVFEAGIVVDSTGSAYVTGTTASTDFPYSQFAFQKTYGGGASDAFAARLDPAGSVLRYSTYLGGSGTEHAGRIALRLGSAYIAGWTASANFPTTAGALQRTLGGTQDAFVLKLDTSASSLVYSTLLGGSGPEQAYFSGTGIGVETDGSAWVTGNTYSVNFPIVSPLQPVFAGGGDVYVSHLNAAGSALVFSTYLGGSYPDAPFGLALDRSGSVYLAGYTASANFPVVAPLQPATAGGRDAFVAKIAAAGGTGGPTPPAAPDNLRATATSASTIVLTWNDNSTTEDGFEVQRKANTSTAVFATIGATGPNGVTFADTGLPGDTIFIYRVRATSTAGPSAWSNLAYARTLKPPNAPSNLAATPLSTTQIGLTWQDNSSDEAGFRIERKTGTPTSAGSYQEIRVVGANVTSFTDGGRAPSTTYSYRVRAYSAIGMSAYSNVATATTQGIPLAPTDLQVFAVAGRSIRLYWRDNSGNEYGFKIERKEGTGLFLPLRVTGPDTMNITDGSLTAGTRYTYRVRAYNAFGNSAYTNEAGATAVP